MTDRIITSGSIIPKNATYIIAKTHEILSGGEKMPNKPHEDDIFIYKDYRYTYSHSLNGWCVELRTGKKDKTRYTKILEFICDKPIIDVCDLFNGCKNLINAPLIPSGVEFMINMFCGCEKLKSPPLIPDGVKSLHSVFRGCKSIKREALIPRGVIHADYMYAGCESIKELYPTIMDTLKYTIGMYRGCQFNNPPTHAYNLEMFPKCSFNLNGYGVYIDERLNMEVEAYAEGKTYHYSRKEAWLKLMELKKLHYENYIPD